MSKQLTLSAGGRNEKQDLPLHFQHTLESAVQEELQAQGIMRSETLRNARKRYETPCWIVQVREIAAARQAQSYPLRRIYDRVQKSG